jgi:hypothetical protein
VKSDCGCGFDEVDFVIDDVPRSDASSSTTSAFRSGFSKSRDFSIVAVSPACFPDQSIDHPMPNPHQPELRDVGSNGFESVLPGRRFVSIDGEPLLNPRFEGFTSVSVIAHI